MWNDGFHFVKNFFIDPIRLYKKKTNNQLETCIQKQKKLKIEQ